MILKHLMGREWVWDFSSFEELKTTHFLLLYFFIPPHVVDSESETWSFVVGAVNESLAFVITRNFAFEFIRQFVKSKILETYFFFVLILPQPGEYIFELARLRITLGTFEFFEVKLDFHFQPCFYLIVVCLKFHIKCQLSCFLFLFFLWLNIVFIGITSFCFGSFPLIFFFVFLFVFFLFCNSECWFNLWSAEFECT